MQGAKNTHHHRTRQSSPHQTRNRQSSFSNQKQRAKQLANQTDDTATHTTAFSMYHSRIRSDAIDNSQIECGTQLYAPTQNIKQILAEFYQTFKKLLKIVPVRYQQIIYQCEDKYQLLTQVLNHYPQSNHLSPYYYHMHSNSTDTKNNLLKMLNQQKTEKHNINQENKDLQYQIKKLTKLIKCKDQAYLDQAQRLRDAQDRIKDLQMIEARCKEYKQKISDMTDQIIEKDRKIAEIQGCRQKMENDLMEIQSQIKTLDYLPQSYKLIEQNKPRQKSLKKIRNNKIPSKHNVQFNNQQNRQIDEDLYRCLLLQASTIQQQILYD